RKRREQAVKRELRGFGGPRRLRALLGSGLGGVRPRRLSPPAPLLRLRAVLGRLRLGALLCLLPALLLPPPAPAPARVRLRRWQVLGERVRDLAEGADLLARALDQLRRARRVAVGRGEQRDTDPDRELERRVDELRRVLLVAVPA